MQFLSYLINGISLGSVYALIALGYTMVYGIAKMLNFAHGDVIMIVSYVIFFSFGSFGLNPIVSVLLSMVVCTILGITMERVAYRPLREAPSLAVLITAIGVSYLLQQVAQLLWTSNPKNFKSVVSLQPIKLFDGQLIISAEKLVTILACILIMVVLTLFINHTSAGHAMLAVSEDRGAAQLMGINVNATISLTFAIGSALAAVAGALMCSSYPTLMPTTGAMPGMPIGKPTCPAVRPSEITSGRRRVWPSTLKESIAPGLTPSFAASAGFSLMYGSGIRLWNTGAR